MAPHNLTSELPRSFAETRPVESDLPHDSGYHSSEDSERRSLDRSNILVDKRDKARPPKKQCVPPPVPPRYLCGTCVTLFDAFEDLSQHFKGDTNTCAASKGHWVCGKCKEPFTEGKSLKRHVTTTGCMINATKTSHICHTCGKAYGRRDNLNRHEKQHRGQSRRKIANTKPAPGHISVEAAVHSAHHGTGVASFSGLRPLTPSNGAGCVSAQKPGSSDSPDFDPSLRSFSHSTGQSSPPVTSSDRPRLTPTTDPLESVASRDAVPPLSSERTANFSRPFPQRGSLDLPLRPKYANKRPGPTKGTTRCPSCRRNIGTSRQELEAHAKSHSGGRYSSDLLCLECMICFDNAEDLRHHIMSASRYGECGFKFKHHHACSGHHPLAHGEITPDPDGDHARMRIAVQTWELTELQDYQFRHNEVEQALPDRSSDCERWTLGAHSLRPSSLWSQRSRPISKRSAPSHTEYTARLPFRNLADRYEQVKAVASLRNATKSWQNKRRADLTAVGAIMNQDPGKLAQILSNGQDPNVRLHTTDTGAANIRYGEQLSGRHPFIPPLILAAEQGFLNGIDMLLCAGADINAVDDNCRTALDWAMTRNNKMACAVLLARGARYVERNDRHVEHDHAYLQGAKDELIEILVGLQRRRPGPERLGCWAHHAILYMDEESFKNLLSHGFSIHSRPLCSAHSNRSFCDLAQGMAPHLLDTLNLPQGVDLQLVLEAISANDVPAIKDLLKPAMRLPISMSTPDALLEFARDEAGVSQGVIDVLADASPWVMLSTPPQEDHLYSRFEVAESNWLRQVEGVPMALTTVFEQYPQPYPDMFENPRAVPMVSST